MCSFLCFLYAGDTPGVNYLYSFPVSLLLSHIRPVTSKPIQSAAKRMRLTVLCALASSFSGRTACLSTIITSSHHSKVQLIMQAMCTDIVFYVHLNSIVLTLPKQPKSKIYFFCPMSFPPCRNHSLWRLPHPWIRTCLRICVSRHPGRLGLCRLLPGLVELRLLALLGVYAAGLAALLTPFQSTASLPSQNFSLAA